MCCLWCVFVYTKQQQHSNRFGHSQYLNIAEIVSSMTTESRVNQHSIQPVELGVPVGLRHEGPQIQMLQILHILMTTKQKISNITCKYPVL